MSCVCVRVCVCVCVACGRADVLWWCVPKLRRAPRRRAHTHGLAPPPSVIYARARALTRSATSYAVFRPTRSTMSSRPMMARDTSASVASSSRSAAPTDAATPAGTPFAASAAATGSSADAAGADAAAAASAASAAAAASPALLRVAVSVAPPRGCVAAASPPARCGGCCCCCCCCWRSSWSRAAACCSTMAGTRPSTCWCASCGSSWRAQRVAVVGVRRGRTPHPPPLTHATGGVHYWSHCQCAACHPHPTLTSLTIGRKSRSMVMSWSHSGVLCGVTCDKSGHGSAPQMRRRGDVCRCSSAAQMMQQPG
jgi:hypothetical protein